MSEQRPALLSRPVGEWLRVIAAAMLIVTVVGCMVGPNYKPPAMKLPEKWNGNDQQMKDAANQGPKTDLATWWQAFDDPLLNAVIAQATVQSYMDVAWLLAVLCLVMIPLALILKKNDPKAAPVSAE